jgi:potassium-transporting ATPase ATP-binding subunit
VIPTSTTSASTTTSAHETVVGRAEGRARTDSSIFRREQLVPALLGSVRKLDPRHQVHNPVMFVVEVGALITTIGWLIQAFGGQPLGGGNEPAWFAFTVAVWLWLTVVFANLAEALAEGRGKAQADALRATRSETVARLKTGGERPASELQPGDLVVVEAGERIPGDGTVIEGIASVDESAITGESAPVIREAGGDRSAVTGGTRVLSDRIVVEITQEPGKSFLDRMIALVEGAERRKTPNEIALNILLAGLTIIFLVAVVTLRPFAEFSGTEASVATLIALLVALIPTTIGALLSAIGIAGMDRLVRRNVLALSGRAVEASGDVDTLLLDKTGTITLGNREATEFAPMPGVSREELAEAAQLSSIADETPEGRSIVVLAKQFGVREHDMSSHESNFVPFSAETRMSGVDMNGRRLRKGAGDAISAFVEAEGGSPPPELQSELDRIGREGGTPLAVARDSQVLGVIYLKDVVKEGMSHRFDQLRAMGIRTVMVTGDNQLTAAKIAEEAGVDDFLAQATPEKKLELIRDEQAGGRLIAMTGDGTNDAPALAQADVGVTMNTGTQAAREAGNMVDLDSNPTKLIEIVEVGKQLLITRGALTTFSIANDVAKYFAILPAIFAATYATVGEAEGPLERLNVMNLGTPESAIISAIVFNALIIPLLVPLALRGVRYRPLGASALLRRNLWIYGLGGIIAPFVGIKLIDLVVNGLLGA